MLEYAKISKILEYSKRGIWPHGKITSRKLKYFLYFLKMLKMERYLDLYFKSPFRYETRGWEYPWVIECLNSLPLGSTVCDCGCGTSGFPYQLYLKGFKVFGLDRFVGNSPEMKGFRITNRHIHKLKGKVEFIDGDIENIPCDSERFDAVICISVMEHIVESSRENPEYHQVCLSEMKRVLKLGGFLVCTYDTYLDPVVAYANQYGWGSNGWYYLDDIEYLKMKWLKSDTKTFTLHDICEDDDAYIVPPDRFILNRAGGFNSYKPFHRLTSVGFGLIK
jgi:SAM-dependent methyltransferase